MIKRTKKGTPMHVLIILAIFLVACFLAYVSFTKPDVFKVSREAVIPAPANKVFAHVNDFAKWNGWSPWAKIDPNCKYKLDGAPGKGQVWVWDGNKEVGAGSMTILDSVENEKLHIRLDFTKPFKNTCEVFFTFTPADGGTKVTWSMIGKNNLIAKIISCFMDCEKMVGGQYEKGLENLKGVVEEG